MDLSKAVVIYVDFETNWANDYTLSKMPTQLYIMDERFKAHGACIAVGDGPIKWFTEKHLNKALHYLHKTYPYAIWVAHNALFDMSILGLRYGIYPRLVIDTAGMSRALIGPYLNRHSLDNMAELLLQRRKLGGILNKTKGIRDLPQWLEQELAGYCVVDLELMRESLKIMAPHFPACELPVMTWVTRMMTKPAIYLDQQKLWDYHNAVVQRKENILQILGIERSVLMSNDQFAALLENMGVEPPLKQTKPSKMYPQGRLAWAFAKTDQGMKDLLEHDDPDVQAVVAARLEVKSTIEETRSRTYATLAECNPVGIPLAYSGAIPTHRFSGRDKLNFQNLARHTVDKRSVIRDSIVAPPGYRFVVSDLSQIEFRITLCLAGHPDVVARMAAGAELYGEFGTDLYGYAVTKKDKPFERQVSKSAVLGSGFGMGAYRFRLYCASVGLKISAETAQRAIDLFRQTYWGVPKLWKKMEACFTQLLREKKPFDIMLGTYNCHFGFEPLFGEPGIRLPNGLWIKYPQLCKDQDGQWQYVDGGSWRKIFGGHFLENLVQALARIVIMEKSVRIDKVYPIVMSLHDELTALVEDSAKIEVAKDWISSVMVEDVPWFPGLALNTETEVGDRYGEAK